MDGRVPDLLGKEHPHAYERPLSASGIEKKGRAIPFVHGYFAPKGTPIPDLQELIERQPKDLEEILRRANAGEVAVKADSVSFSRPRAKGTDWDRLATEFEQGKYPLKGATFSQEGTLLHRLEPSEGMKAAAGGFSEAIKNRSIPKALEKLGFLKVTGISLAALAIGYAGWRLIKSHQHTAQEQGGASR
jgi:hypothetical protein